MYMNFCMLAFTTWITFLQLWLSYGAIQIVLLADRGQMCWVWGGGKEKPALFLHFLCFTKTTVYSLEQNTEN